MTGRTGMRAAGPMRRTEPDREWIEPVGRVVSGDGELVRVPRRQIEGAGKPVVGLDGLPGRVHESPRDVRGLVGLSEQGEDILHAPVERVVAIVFDRRFQPRGVEPVSIDGQRQAIRLARLGFGVWNSSGRVVIEPGRKRRPCFVPPESDGGPGSQTDVRTPCRTKDSGSGGIGIGACGREKSSRTIATITPAASELPKHVTVCVGNR